MLKFGAAGLSAWRAAIRSFPIHSNGHDLEIVQGQPINDLSRAKINLTVNELKEEKGMVKELLQG
jgi:hypothetical protein